jgi:kynurenine 3-monooxygenase
MKKESPVVIVGGGLSGLVMANLLSRQGKEIVIIEKRSNPLASEYSDNRSINITLSPRGMRAFQRIGLDQEIKKVSVPVFGRMVHIEDTPPVYQSYGGDDSLTLWVISRSDLHKILVRALSSIPNVELKFDTKFICYKKQFDQIYFEDKAGNVDSLTPSFCIGADGAFSPLRQSVFKGELANYSQEFFDWTYKQFDISPDFEGNHRLDPNAVHVWPKKNSLLIAIANIDGSFNCNLFLSRQESLSFQTLERENGWADLLLNELSDLGHIGKEIVDQLSKNPECGILRNSLTPWHYKDRVVFIGDACHATYHFYAQGLNASLEDCLTLFDCLAAMPDQRSAFLKYQQLRKPNTDVLSVLSEENFDTLKNRVGKPSFQAKYLMERILCRFYPWKSSYRMIADGRYSYLEAAKREKTQRRIWSSLGLSWIQAFLTGLIAVHRRFTGLRISPARRSYSPIPRYEKVESYRAVSGLFRIFLFTVCLGSQCHGVSKKIEVGIASTLADVGSNSSIPHGDFFRRGINLALEDQKIALEKKGVAISIREFDYGNSRMQVLEMAKQAIQSNVVAVIGYNFSDHALLVAPIHHREGLALITPTATADRVATVGAYVHQMSFNNSFQAKLLAKLADDTLNAKHVAAIVAQDCTYCRDLEGDFKTAFLTKPGHEFKTFPVLKGDSDFEETVKQLKTSQQKFDLIFIPNHELTSAKIILALLKAGIKGPFLGGDGWANYGGRTFQSMFSDWSFKAYAISHWHEKWSNPISNQFLSEYTSKYQSVPNMTAAMAYDSMRYLLQGILFCNSYSRKSIEECLSKIEEFEGTTGHYRFRKNQSPEKGLVLQEFKKNRFEFLKVVTP